jgi:uncharacterized protein (TIGR00297 family)
MEYLTLDVDGVILAFLMAFIMLYVATFSEPTLVYGWILGIFYVAVMLYFLMLSAIVTKYGWHYKLSIRQSQKPRGVKNVLANGLGPLIFVLIVFFVAGGKFGSIAFIAGFLGSVAAVTSDKFSSEIGILNGAPVSIMSFKKIRKGESGGITMLGLIAGMLGAFLIAVVAGSAYLYLIPPTYSCPVNGCGTIPAIASFALVSAIFLGGFIGTLVDSVLGYFEEKGTGNKYTSNFICSMAGGIVGVVLYFIIFNFLVA